jgi:TolB-like protein
MAGGWIGELRRRNVFRMAGLYLVGAWLIVQVAGTVLPMFDAPAWLPRSVVILLAIGFVPALAFSWVFELTPEGLRRDGEVPAGQSIAPQTGRRMDRMIIVALLLAVAYFGFDKFVLSRAADEPSAAAVAQPAANATPAAPEKSIAVMAFADLSPGGDQAYFSDGMSEAILSALSQVPGLRVAGRSSSFHFRGRNADAREIGRALGVAHILEGSVRKQDDRVRISAQLVRTSDGIQLWSETFDGELNDVFELQDQIARAITGQLQLVLEGGAQARLVPVMTDNPDAYQLYLQATSIFDRRDFARFPEAIAALRRAVELDPRFARAYSRLAAIEVVVSSYGDRDVAESHELVLRAANAALALDPNLAEPWAAIGLSHGKLRGGFLAQREAFERAIALDPDDVTTNFWYGLSLCMTGYGERGRQFIEHALEVDPRMPNVVRWRGILYLHAGDTLRAEQYVSRARSDGLLVASRELADIAHRRGDVEGAVRLWPDGARAWLASLPAGSAEVLGAGMYGNDPAARQRALALLEDFLESDRRQVPGVLLLALVKLGEPARALEVGLEHGVGDFSDFSVLTWSPAGRPIRQLPEFPGFLREMGYYELWDKYGPPDVCQRVAMGEYRCD